MFNTWTLHYWSCRVALLCWINRVLIAILVRFIVSSLKDKYLNGKISKSNVKPFANFICTHKTNFSRLRYERVKQIFYIPCFCSFYSFKLQVYIDSGDLITPTDEYRLSCEKRAKIAVEIARTNGVKLNSADYSSTDLRYTMRQIGTPVENGNRLLRNQWSCLRGSHGKTIRFIVLPSYVKYSCPVGFLVLIIFLTTDVGSWSRSRGNDWKRLKGNLVREAFFLGFAKETREKFPNLVLMLVGGFRSRTGAEPMVIPLD